MDEIQKTSNPTREMCKYNLLKKDEINSQQDIYSRSREQPVQTGASQRLLKRFIQADDIDQISNKFEHLNKIFSTRGEFGCIRNRCLET